MGQDKPFPLQSYKKLIQHLPSNSGSLLPPSPTLKYQEEEPCKTWSLWPCVVMSLTPVFYLRPPSNWSTYFFYWKIRFLPCSAGLCGLDFAFDIGLLAFVLWVASLAREGSSSRTAARPRQREMSLRQQIPLLVVTCHSACSQWFSTGMLKLEWGRLGGPPPEPAAGEGGWASTPCSVFLWVSEEN